MSTKVNSQNSVSFLTAFHRFTTGWFRDAAKRASKQGRLGIVATLLGATAAGLSIHDDLTKYISEGDYILEVVEQSIFLPGIEAMCLDGSELVKVTTRSGTVSFPASCKGRMIRINHPKTNRILDTRTLGESLVLRVEVQLQPAEREFLFAPSPSTQQEKPPSH